MTRPFIEKHEETQLRFNVAGHPEQDFLMDLGTAENRDNTFAAIENAVKAHVLSVLTESADIEICQPGMVAEAFRP